MASSGLEDRVSPSQAWVAHASAQKVSSECIGLSEMKE